MKFEDLIKQLKANNQAKIKPESTPEELKAISEEDKNYDDALKEYNDLVKANSQYKETIINMIVSQGTPGTPKDPNPTEDKPKTLEEIIQEKTIEQDKGGK